MSTKTITPLGPLLLQALKNLQRIKHQQHTLGKVLLTQELSIRAHLNEDGLLPIVLKLPTAAPKRKENWANYKARILEYMYPVNTSLQYITGTAPKALVAANSIKLSCTPKQVEALTHISNVSRIELDPLVLLVSMNEVEKEIDVETFRQKNPGGINGKGIRLALLDSGADLRHPYLKIAKSVSTCGETDELPGAHGTHCAGIIASTDESLPGIAPGVELLNIKVLRASGFGTHTDILSGIDIALDLNADIISMSVGFNHLPTHMGGHGWQCTNGDCPLCTAVDNAVFLDNVIVVVAAGNEHLAYENLRKAGLGGRFDTELMCPGQAREAITVGAITKGTRMVADFSSRGPTSYGLHKPEIYAPGVNIMSTIPVPISETGDPGQPLNRSKIFGSKSGTSMATPIVAGGIALILQKMKQNNRPYTIKDVKNELNSHGICSLDTANQDEKPGRLVFTNL